ncbi:hypothetical protein SAMN05421690_10563 [Nitrosomonas sp. Nm51]|uniref:hypothetical protein n=1 Tax=Nitrosomonas sp. Nm51 TaxID=133720 RepID=UPI0008BC9296|nr:hypothetical protein [Nitrosomonas sp. Nm51]SER70240.1 hypothetical protein SAMN05421690_10563 [Nitrosomonas sp. Nm51]
MPKKDSYKGFNERFKLLNRSVSIQTEGDRVTLAVDNDVHEVKFLKNGRPYTKAYVNVMATSIRDYAERFVKFTDAQEKHWALVDAERKKS